MIAYELRAEYQGDVEQVLEWDPTTDPPTPIETQTVPRFGGGVLAIDDSRSVDLREELDKGNGRIVVDELDSVLIQRLDESPALKRVAADDDEEPADVGLEDLPVADLRRRAEVAGVKLEAGIRKPELVAGLVELERRLAAGDESASPTETRTVTIQANGELAVVETTEGQAS